MSLNASQERFTELFVTFDAVNLLLLLNGRELSAGIVVVVVIVVEVVVVVVSLFPEEGGTVVEDVVVVVGGGDKVMLHSKVSLNPEASVAFPLTIPLLLVPSKKIVSLIAPI